MTATASTISHVYPIGSRVNERGRLEIGGCDAVELVREFGSPAYIVAEDDLRARARSFMDAVRARHADYDVLFASKAFPCTAVYRLLAEEGLACDVASGGELFLALRGGFDPARIYFHGNAKSAGRGARRVRGRGRSHRDRLARRARPARAGRRRLGRRPAAGGPDPGHPRGGRRHPSRDLDRADRLEVRFLAGGREGRDRAARRRFPPGPRRAAFPHRLAVARARAVPWRRCGRSRRSATSRCTTSAAGSGSAYTASVQPPQVVDYVDAIVSAVHSELGPGQAAAARAGPGAGRELDGHAVHGADRQAERVDLGGGRRWDVGQPPADAVRLEVRGRGGRSAAGGDDRAVPSRRQALRIRRRDRARRVARRPQRPAT